MQMAGPGILQFGLESCQIFFHKPNWNHTYKLEPLVSAQLLCRMW